MAGKDTVYTMISKDRGDYDETRLSLSLYLYGDVSNDDILAALEAAKVLDELAVKYETPKKPS